MVCTWRPLVEKFGNLLWQARVGREIERKGIGNKKGAGGIRITSRLFYGFWRLLLGSPFPTETKRFRTT
jgi:hypothetical protein